MNDFQDYLVCQDSATSDESYRPNRPFKSWSNVDASRWKSVQVLTFKRALHLAADEETIQVGG